MVARVTTKNTSSGCSALSAAVRKPVVARSISRLALSAMLVVGAALLFTSSAYAQISEETDSTQATIELELLVEEPAAADDSSAQDSLGQPEFPPLEKLPVLSGFVQAVYPTEVYQQGIEGTVRLELLVNESGTVDSARVLGGVHPLLDSSALAAARQFVFEPAQAGGDSVAVLIEYEYRFTLQEVVSALEEYVNFSGVVVERGTRAPVVDALVVVGFNDTLCTPESKVPLSTYLEKLGSFEGQYLEGNNLVSVTDSLGRFAFKSLPPCAITVKIPVPGFEVFQEQESIGAAEATEVTYRINKVSYNDYEVVVYGKSEVKEVAKRSLTLTEVKKIPGFGGDAVKVVQALPGVARSSFGGGQIIVRGARTWDSQFLLDGVVIPQLYHFGGLKSTYNSDALSTVDLYPGGFSARYGNTIGGVVEIDGRPGKSDRIHGKGDASFLDASFVVEGPVKDKATVLLSARRSYVGDLLGWAVENVPALNIPITVAPFYWDYVARTDLTLHPDHSTFVTFFGSKDALELVVPGVRGGSKLVDDIVDRIKQEVLFHLILVGWDWNISPRLKNELRADVVFARNSTSLFGIASWKAATTVFEMRDELSFKVLPALILKLGTNLQHIPYRQTSVFPVASGEFLRDTLDGTYGLAGAYLMAEWTPISQLTVIPGLRYDYYPELRHKGGVVPELWNYEQFNNDRGYAADPSLRLAVRYSPFKEHTVKAAFGNYNQTPQPMGLATHKEFGNPDLPTTKAQHVVGGYEWQITDLLFADVQFYLNRQWEIPDFESDADVANSEGGAFSTQRFYPQGRARMRGMELLIRHDQGNRFFGWLAYTLSRAERYDRINKEFVLFDQDQTHNLQLVGSMRLPKNFEAGVRARYVTGNPYTPTVGSYYDAYYRTYVAKPGQPNSERVPPFFQVDLRVDKKFIYDVFMMSLYLDIQNVAYFIYKSPEFMVSNYNPYDIKKGMEDRQAISFPFLPSIGIMVEF